MRTSRGKAGGTPRTVYLEISIWRDDGALIHVAHNDPDGPETFHVAVGSGPAKPTGHPRLYDELSKCLSRITSGVPSRGTGAGGA